jgi:hypothetical protein
MFMSLDSTLLTILTKILPRQSLNNSGWSALPAPEKAMTRETTPNNAATALMTSKQRASDRVARISCPSWLCYQANGLSSS